MLNLQSDSVQKRSLNILVAEDETDISALVSTRLRNEGHTVVLANDGQEALERMAEKQPRHYDLLITDSNMPRVSGFELVGRMRKGGFSGKIIMASAFKTVDPEVVEQSNLVDRIVHKPYLMADLQVAVEELFLAPEPAVEIQSAPAALPVPAVLSFQAITKVGLWQFAFWAIADMISTWIGLRSGLIEGNPFSAWTMNMLSPVAGLIIKEILVTSPICIGGGYICYRMAVEMSQHRKAVLANLPVWIGVGLHCVATLNNVWALNS